MEDPVRQKFITIVEALAKDEGLSPISGRLLGYLITAPGPVLFSDLAKDLDISRGSVSHNTRHLETIGLIARARHPGARGDCYWFREDGWAALVSGAQIRTAARIAEIEAILRMTDPDSQAGRHITQMCRFLKLNLEALAEISRTLTETKDRQA